MLDVHAYAGGAAVPHGCVDDEDRSLGLVLRPSSRERGVAAWPIGVARSYEPALPHRQPNARYQEQDPGPERDNTAPMRSVDAGTLSRKTWDRETIERAEQDFPWLQKQLYLFSARRKSDIFNSSPRFLGDAFVFLILTLTLTPAAQGRAYRPVGFWDDLARLKRQTIKTHNSAV